MRLRGSILFIFVFSVLQVYGQYKQHRVFDDYYTARAIGNERIWQRMYIGGGTHIVTGRAQLQYNGPDSTGKWINVDHDQKLRGAKSFMLQAGSYFPIVLISDNTALALNAELMFSYAELSFDSVAFQPRAVYSRPVPYIIAGIPLSLDFKSGGDVSLSKVRRQMFTLGVGAVGGISTASVAMKRSEIPLTAIPFVKAEIGMFAGIAFKLRGVAYLRNAININETFSNIFTQDQVIVKMHAGYGYHVSLIIMPFSYGWRTEEWY